MSDNKDLAELNPLSGTFVGNVTYFVTSRLPYIYLACLITAFFVARAKVDPAARVDAVLEVSTTMTMYYAFLSFAIGFFLNIPLVFNNLVFQLLLLWAIVAYYNLFLTTFAHLWTFAKSVGEETVEPEQNLLNILFDTRLKRIESAPLFAWVLGIPLPNFEAGSKFFEPLKVIFTGKECKNTWSGNNRRLLFSFSSEVSENFMGKLCWYLEDSALGIESNTGGFGRCGWLRVVQILYSVLGFATADSFYKMAINDNSLEESVFRKQSSDDIFNKGNKFLRQNGVACRKQDLRSFYAAISGSSNQYQNTLATSRILSAISQVDGAVEDYAKFTGQSAGSPNFTLEPLDERILNKFSSEFKTKVTRKYQGLTSDFVQRKLIDFTKVSAYYDNALLFQSLGLTPGLIVQEVNEGRLSLNQDLPEEHGKFLIGQAATINGQFYPENQSVIDARNRGIENFGPQNDCEFAYNSFSCCDTRFRPFDSNKGTLKRKSPLGFYKIQAFR